MKYLQITALCILTILISAGTFLYPAKEKNPTGNPNLVKEEWIKESQIFLHNLESWKESPYNMDGYRAVRKSLKRLEPIWEFVDKTQYNSKINAAPLLKPEPKNIDFTILPPQGIQVIDELIIEKGNDAEIEQLIEKLIKETQLAVISIRKYNFTERVIIESLRHSLNRAFNLGLSNFDTPGTGLEFFDAAQLFAYHQEIFNQQFKQALEAKDASLYKNIHSIQNALRSELSEDLITLNYLKILREYILPLQSYYNSTQEILAIEYKDEISAVVQAINPRADHFFSPDFLNSGYYSEVIEADRNPDMVLLGELLFNDPILSANNQRACASCHNPDIAFTDGKSKSTNFSKDGHVARNSPSLINAIYADRYFHDLRADNLIGQMDHVVHDENEFNTDFSTICSKLEQSKEYRQLFKKNFPKHKQAISKHTVTKAISVYLDQLQAFNAPFDKYVRKETEKLNPDAMEGFNLFMGKANCASCHFAPLYSGLVPPYYLESETEVLGVWEQFDTIAPKMDKDLGRYGSKLVSEQYDFHKHSFKTTSLRNSAETAPYMHNGAYKNLEEVLHFYNKGGGKGMGLDVPYQTLAEDHLNLSQKEMDAIIAFLNQLSDNPYKEPKKKTLPSFENKAWNTRIYSGAY